MGKAVLVVALIALVIYALLRLWEKRKAARQPRPLRPPQAPGTRRVVAPDDDVDFLRNLEQKRRRDKRGEQRKGPSDGGPTGKSPRQSPQQSPGQPPGQTPGPTPGQTPGQAPGQAPGDPES